MDAIYKNVKSVCCTPETYINKLYYHKKGKKKIKGTFLPPKILPKFKFSLFSDNQNIYLTYFLE